MHCIYVTYKKWGKNITSSVTFPLLPGRNTGHGNTSTLKALAVN